MAEGSFSSRLTEQRKRKGVSQKVAAKELGISQALLSHYENGIRECGLDFVVRAADYYGVTCDYLLGHQSDVFQMEAPEEPMDLGPDRDLTLQTDMGALLTVGRILTQDPELEILLTRIFGMNGYLALWAGVQTGALPQNWLGDHPMGAKQVFFLMTQLMNEIQHLPEYDRLTKDPPPDTVEVVTRWAYDRLNEEIAGML